MTRDDWEDLCAAIQANRGKMFLLPLERSDMTRDELKAATLAGIDRVLMLPRLLVGYDSRRLLYAAQSYWQTASDAELDRLLGLVPQAREEEAPPSIDQRLWAVETKVELVLRQLADISDVLARLDPSPFSPRPQQRRDAMSAPNQAGGNPLAAHPQLAAINWQDVLRQVNWLQVLQFFQFVLTQFQQTHATAQGAATPAGGMQSAMAGCDKMECLREHFNTIEQVAACGAECCDAP
jgi:hypothetical protein